jgi:hypothetical protein
MPARIHFKEMVKMSERVKVAIIEKEISQRNTHKKHEETSSNAKKSFFLNN